LRFLFITFGFVCLEKIPRARPRSAARSSHGSVIRVTEPMVGKTYKCDPSRWLMGFIMSALQAVSAEQWIPSTCGMCLHGCGIKVLVKDGVALKIEGDESNPDNLGKLCPKGNAGLSRLYDSTRVLKPMKRTNPRKGPGVDPGWVEISWEEAYATTARELGKIRQEDPRKLLCAIGDFQRIILWG